MDKDEERRRIEEAKLPAGLPETGRDQDLTTGDEILPTGNHADGRRTVPGTTLPEPSARPGDKPTESEETAPERK